jgi:type IV pilus assembly protein PilW
MTRRRPVARGISLVELLIGIAVGLFVVAGAAFMLSNQLSDGRRLMLETQVQQDLRAAADMVVRELRRAGYTPTAADAAWYRGTPGVTQSGYATIEAPSDSDLRFRYGIDADNAVDDNEQFGFRRRGSVIEYQLGAGNWQALTDPDTLVVTDFTISLRRDLAPIALNRFCPRNCIGTSPMACQPMLNVREFIVRVEGHAANDPRVRRSLRAAVRPRNDLITGSCDS